MPALENLSHATGYADVAKRRRQGLVVCRATLPFEGLFDARPGVALAPVE
jgi:hypothetical protein